MQTRKAGQAGYRIGCCFPRPARVAGVLVFLLLTANCGQGSSQSSSDPGPDHAGPRSAPHAEARPDAGSDWKLDPASMRRAVERFDALADVEDLEIVRKDVIPGWGPGWMVRTPEGDYFEVAERSGEVVEVKYRTYEAKAKEHIDTRWPCAAGRVKISWDEAVGIAGEFAVDHWGEDVLDGLVLSEESPPDEMGNLCRYEISFYTPQEGCKGEVQFGSKDVWITVDAVDGEVLKASLCVFRAPEHVNLDIVGFRRMITEEMGNVPGLKVECIHLVESWDEQGVPFPLWVAYCRWSCEGYPENLPPACMGYCQLIVNGNTGKIIDKSCH